MHVYYLQCISLGEEFPWQSISGSASAWERCACRSRTRLTRNPSITTNSAKWSTSSSTTGFAISTPRTSITTTHPKSRAAGKFREFDVSLHGTPGAFPVHTPDKIVVKAIDEMNTELYGFTQQELEDARLDLQVLFG